MEPLPVLDSLRKQGSHLPPPFREDSKKTLECLRKQDLPSLSGGLQSVRLMVVNVLKGIC